MSMYSQFSTDEDLERQGIVVDYGDFRVRVARAGGGNKKYARVLEQLTKPYRRAIQTETMDDERGLQILRQAFARAVVLDWETKVDGEFQRGIESPDGGLLDPTEENIIETFKNLPDLFLDIKSQAEKSALYRRDALEVEAGN